jgi:glycerol-3-phosphate dehydrogenase (NAD(P)+)
MRDQSKNQVYLPGAFIDPTIAVTSELAMVCEQPDLLILAVPAQYLRSQLITLSNYVNSAVPILIASKGIERGSLMMMSEVAESVMPGNPIAVISGPNFAIEVAKGLPAATAIGCVNKDLGNKIIYSIGSTLFRPYYTNDITGVQIGGAVKNVIAIACGIAMGKKLGENARAAIITRGLAEISRLASAKGAKESTVMGLSGMGDLVLTCASVEKSRNVKFGMELAQGKTLDELFARHATTTEGAFTVEAAVALADKYGIDVPICKAVDEVLNHGADVEQTVNRLLSRPFTSE